MNNTGKQQSQWKRQSKLCTLQDTKPGVLLSSKRLQTCESPGKSHARAQEGGEKKTSHEISPHLLRYLDLETWQTELCHKHANRKRHTHLDKKRFVENLASFPSTLQWQICSSQTGDLKTTSSLPIHTLYSLTPAAPATLKSSSRSASPSSLVDATSHQHVVLSSSSI